MSRRKKYEKSKEGSGKSMCVCGGGINRKVRKKVEKVCGGGKKDEKCVFH